MVLSSCRSVTARPCLGREAGIGDGACHGRDARKFRIEGHRHRGGLGINLRTGYTWHLFKCLLDCDAACRTGHVRSVEQQIGRATSELQSLMRISYAVFCLKKTKEKH